MSSASATAASALHETAPSANVRHFLLRRLHSLTGIIFGGYVVIHLLVNASLIEGRRHSGDSVYQIQVNKIHELPFLLLVETTFIYLPILFHTIYGIWITVTGKPNVTHYPFAKNWFYLLQRVSAMVLVAFILFHILGMKGVFGGEVGRALTFEPAQATESTIAHMKAAWWVGWVVYPIGILAATYHLANGFWTAAITWGLTVSKAAQKRWGVICAGLFVLTFAAGMTALISAMAQDLFSPLPGQGTHGPR